ncbi:GMC oxidoreductase [Priestia megaterium]|uniref:GMC oxidoreductase n=1 Tax=Priestia megaterium TaxID=1404 RepID=UPI00188F04E5|nr:GMC oxidoreductase [Priestia megaterium]
MKTSSSSPNFNYGYPTPGPQNPTGSKVMDHVFFLSHEGWKRVREEEKFDFIIIGSSFCALGFADRILEKDPSARILIIERGPFFLPEHFQNLPLPFQRTLGGLSETFPWTLSASTLNQQYIKWQHGMVPFFGGRSTLWSAWCPRPTRDEMRGWPEEVINAAHNYFEQAEKLLNVISANEIDKDQIALPNGYRPIFGTLQKQLTARLEEHLNMIESATRVMPAPLAVGSSTVKGIDFDKFSTPGPLLTLVMKQRQLAQQEKGAKLQIVTDCVVSRIVQQEGRATALETSRGTVNVGDAKVILAMGTLPPTTLIMNSFPQVANVGRRFTAHFISAIVARIPRIDYEFNAELGELELGAIYLAGENKHTGGQYHIQLTALSDRDPDKNAATAARHMPDVVATASIEQLQSSKDYIVFVCAVLGETDYNNQNNWVRKTDGNELDTNVLLQVEENENDLAVWDTMDEGTFQALERVLSPNGPNRVEYWHEDSNGSGTWKASRPDQSEIRQPGMVHEGSTLYIGSDEEAVVGLDYRPKGVENVYVTGASLWPVSGSWNPTLTMVSLAQHLADTLSKQPRPESSSLEEGSLEATKTSSAMS